MAKLVSKQGIWLTRTPGFFDITDNVDAYLLRAKRSEKDRRGDIKCVQ